VGNCDRCRNGRKGTLRRPGGIIDVVLIGACFAGAAVAVAIVGQVIKEHGEWVERCLTGVAPLSNLENDTGPERDEPTGEDQ